MDERFLGRQEDATNDPAAEGIGHDAKAVSDHAPPVDVEPEIADALEDLPHCPFTPGVFFLISTFLSLSCVLWPQNKEQRSHFCHKTISLTSSQTETYPLGKKLL